MAELKILEKIQGLLSLANNNSSEKEAELAAEKAAALMAKHGIEMRQVQDLTKGQQKREEVVFGESGLSKDESMGKWQGIIGNTCAKISFCYAVRSPHKGVMTFIGTKEEVDACKALYEWLCMQTAFVAGQSMSDDKVKGKRNVQDYFLGMATRVSERLLAKFNDTVDSYQGGSLIVRATSEKNRSFAFVLFPNLRSSTLSQRYSKSYFNGMKAGEKVKLGEEKAISGSQAKNLGGGRRALA